MLNVKLLINSSTEDLNRFEVVIVTSCSCPLWQRCVCWGGVDTNGVFVKATSTVWITVARCVLAAHTHKVLLCRLHTHSHFPPMPGQAGRHIINSPASRYYVSSRPRRWPPGSQKKWQRLCPPLNKVSSFERAKLWLFLLPSTSAEASLLEVQ